MATQAAALFASSNPPTAVELLVENGAFPEAAEEAFHRAQDDASRREAALGLGSAHLHAGRLSEAAAALEVACGPGSPAHVSRAAAGWLAAARWWAGDLVGAIAAAEMGNGEPVAAWVEAEVKLARGEGAIQAGPSLGGGAVVAKALLAAGDVERGRSLADRASVTGGPYVEHTVDETSTSTWTGTISLTCKTC